MVPDLGRPEFSSSFGLLSLDDPNVLAGIATDGAPFFDDPGQAHNQPRSATSGSTASLGDTDTPMPMRRDSGQLPLLPVEGSQRFPISTHQNPSTFSSNPGVGGPTPSAYLRRTSCEIPAGMGLNINTSVSGEDLRSYEAAVMARKAPTTLNLKVRKHIKGGEGGGGTGGKLKDEGSTSASSGGSPHAISGDATTLSDSSSSSLANAFGTGQRLHSHSRDQTVLSAPARGVPLESSAPVGRTPLDRVKKEDSLSPSLSPPASSLSLEEVEQTGGNGSQYDLGGMEVPSSATGRPSFKRLPSQTLGPDNSKRPFYGFGDDDVEDRAAGGWGVLDINHDNHKPLVDRRDFLVGAGGVAERRMRKRRMSEPSSVGNGFDRE